MVHRAPDSRLLTNLINHEKEYARHLAALFPLSHAALASLSAYAAASPSSQRTIAAVVDVLASADDALQRYARALDTWRGQLIALKDLEDDLSAVLRDRDILVTRLIKASKSTRDTHRSSRLVAPLGSASHSSLPSTNSTAFSSTGSSPASTNAKLAQAQTELQACEAHLVSKERELDARRITLARDDLGARCRALVDCGWVWSEMGKQGLRALQALGIDENGGHTAPKQSLAIPSHLNTRANPATYGSDNSSLTPSQSASQTAARSIETSQEGPASKENDRVESETTSKHQARSTRASEDADLTITLPSSHAISEPALPTSARMQPRLPENGDPTPAEDAGTSSQSTSASKRKGAKRSRRPPSQQITEVSDEGSDDAPSASHRNASANPRAPHTPFPTARGPGTRDTSSDDEPTGPLQVVENDPFEVIRRSMLGPAAGSSLLATTTPTARASAPDVRVSAVDDSSTSKIAFPESLSLSGHGHVTGIRIGLPRGTVSSPTRRQRRTSIFGSLRGLFRKPRERPGVEWDESPSPASPNQRTKTSGWVTRTDARIDARGGREDSDDEVTPKSMGTSATVTNLVNKGRGAAGARLRKGRPSAQVRENGPSRVTSHRGVDGWITDNPAGTGTGADTGIDTNRPSAGTAKSGTRRATMKRRKTSVADLRGSDQGHTDGEVDRSLACVSSKGTGEVPESSVSMPVIEIGFGRQVVAPAEANPVSAPNSKATATPDVGQGTQHRRATTTTATASRKLSSNGAPAHRRSASLSLIDAHTTIMSMSTPSQAPTQNMSWRKPPPKIEPPTQSASLVPSRSQSQSQLQFQGQAQSQPSSRMQELQPKQNARRNIGNGHAKHVQNQSLMSIVADVTRQNLDQDGERDRAWVTDKARSLDLPRAPGSVLHEWDREVGATETKVGAAETEVERAVPLNARGHARAASSPEGGGQLQGQGQRAIKLPLKSVLRNASRTPSPSPGPTGVIAPPREAKEAKKDRADQDRGRVVSPAWRDSASISSYETGRESLDGEEVEGAFPPSSQRPPSLHSLSRSPGPRSQSLDLRARSQTLSPLPPTLSFTFPPPPVDPPPVRAGTIASKPILTVNASTNEPPSSSTSTETPSVQHRKSVRMSLQPTFSPSPPALCDEDEGYAPWSERGGRGRGSRGEEARGGHGPDVWADSSEEDEAYSRARRLLSLVGRSKT